MIKQKFTLIELMVVIVIIGILGTVAFQFFTNISSRMSADCTESPSQRMYVYVKNLYGYSDINTECSTIDSDYNGYFRCTAVGKNEKEELVTILAECSKCDCAAIQGIYR